MLSIKQKLKNYLDNKNYCRITRKVAENSFEDSYGYILDFSDDYILLQEVDQFSVEGYVIFPVWMVSQLRFNNHEKYYDKILRLEKESDKVMKKHKIDLTNWNSIFKSIKKEGFNVIVEDENPEIKIYEIGPIIRITESGVYIKYFDPKGFLENKPTKISFDLITIVRFDNRYINIFSKYLRQKKIK